MTAAMATDSILERRRSAVRQVQRRQLVDGFAAAVAAKGYAAVTIADVVGYARTSKTTFYEHFADKEAAYLALHESLRAALEAAVGDALARTAGARLRDRVDAVVRGYLRALTEDPARLVQVHVETQVATPAAVTARLASRSAFAARITQALAEPGEPGPSEVAVRLGLAGTTEVVAEVAVRTAEAAAAAQAVLALRHDLVEIWTRLLSPAGRPVPPAAGGGGPVRPARSAATTDWRPGY